MTTSLVGDALIVRDPAWHRLDAGANQPSSRPGQGGDVVVDMVFRRLETPADFSGACRAFGACGPPLTQVWFGLWNLTADDGDALVAIAATRRISSRVIEIHAVETHQGYAVQARLLRELADTCRAHGVEWLVAAADGAGTDVRRRQGLVVAADRTMPEIRAGWLAFQV